MSTAGQDKFINKLYHDYYNAIVAYCSAMVNDTSDGELCAQDVFRQAYIDCDKLINHPNIIGWLKVTAKNRVNRFIREKTQKRTFEVHITDLSENHLSSMQFFDEYDNSFSEEFGDVDAQKDKILSMLSEEERNLYELRFTKGLTYKEIAPLIGKSESATRIRTVRLELRIRELVAEMFG